MLNDLSMRCLFKRTPDGKKLGTTIAQSIFSAKTTGQSDVRGRNRFVQGITQAALATEPVGPRDAQNDPMFDDIGRRK